MMLNFTLSAECPECGGPMVGFKCAWTKRINLNSIPVESSIGFRKACEECGSEVWPDQVRMRLDDASAAGLEAARDKIRAKRKSAR